MTQQTERDAQPLYKAAPVAPAKPNCKECAKWVQEQSDNKDWIDGVARGKKIIEQLAAQEIMKGAKQ